MMGDGEITGEGRREKLTPKDLNKLSANFRAALTSEQKDEYKQLATDSSRREWMAAWVVYPEGFRCRGYNTAETVNSAHDIGEGAWRANMLKASQCQATSLCQTAGGQVEAYFVCVPSSHADTCNAFEQRMTLREE